MPRPSLIDLDDQSRAVLLPWWALQILAWALYCVVSFLSLTLWYGDPEWLHAVQILLEAMVGALLVFPLDRSLKYIGRLNVAVSFLVQCLLVAGLAFIWNVLRMTTFRLFFPEAQIWKDFGGWYFASILVFALWTTLHYIVRAYTTIAQEHERAQQEHLLRVTAESLSRDAQLQMLRYQINPHFIFNTMNSINALVVTNRTVEARHMIERFSDFLRITLDDENRLFVPLHEEIETIDRYLAVEQMRFASRLEIEFSIDPDCRDVPVPPLILQPIIENAVRYGVEGQNEKCLITLSARRDGTHVEIGIADTGPGLARAAEQPVHGTGLGLKNVAARLEAAYANDFAFAIADRPGRPGTLVTIRVPAPPPEAKA